MGVMISEGRNYITTQWWLTAMPAAAILLLVAAFNLIGDGLRICWIPGWDGRTEEKFNHRGTTKI